MNCRSYRSTAEDDEKLAKRLRYAETNQIAEWLKIALPPAYSGWLLAAVALAFGAAINTYGGCMWNQFYY